MASPDRILTTHVGSLPRPERLIELNAARAGGGAVDQAAYDEALAEAVTEVVARQREAGVDVAQRRRVRPRDGPRVRLRDVAQLHVLADGRLRDGARRPARPAAPAGARLARALAHAGPPRLDALQRGLRRSALGRGDAAVQPQRPGRHGLAADHLPRAGGDGPRHRQHEGGARGQRPRGRLPQRGRAGELRARRQRVLRDRRGARLRLRRRDARGVRGDHRVGPRPPARRPGDRRDLGPDQPRAARSRPTSASRWSASTRSTTRSAGCPRTASASTSAGAAGTARTRPTSRWPTSST